MKTLIGLIIFYVVMVGIPYLILCPKKDKNKYNIKKYQTEDKDEDYVIVK